MVHYNPRSWFTLIFKFHKYETFRKLIWMMVSLAAISYVIVYLELEVFEFKPRSATVMHSLLGFVISLLLVFRTNTAYDRWWEGRKQWGMLVNVSRNFMLKTTSFVESAETKSKVGELTAAYSNVLKEHLRNAPSDQLSALLPSFAQAEKTIGHYPNYIALHLQREVRDMHVRKELSQAAYLAMLEDLNAFTDIMGACERIKKTPIPYIYNTFIKKFIFIYIISMPFAFVTEFGYWTVAVTVFTFYTFVSLEIIAEEIEDPFGTDANDLPTDEMARNIRKNIDELLGL